MLNYYYLIYKIIINVLNIVIMNKYNEGLNIFVMDHLQCIYIMPSYYSRGVDPVLKVGGQGTNLYIHICI